MKTLLLGGARSGKSRHAQMLATASGLQVVYIATATAGDTEMAARIEQHRQDRPADWLLCEEPLRLAAVLAAQAAPERCVLVDCLTLWLSNLLLAGEERLHAETQALYQLLPQLPGRLLLVSNEVGMGIVPMGELSRAFVDHAGRLHQNLASYCEQVLLVVAGLPLTLKNEEK